MNKVLFLTTSDQSHHWLSEFTHTCRTYDFNNWVEGFKEVSFNEFNVFDFYSYFINNGLNKLQNKLLQIINVEKYDFLILPTIFYEVKVETLQIIKEMGVQIIVCFFDDSMRFKNYNIYYAQVADYIITHETKKSLELYTCFDYKLNFFANFPSYNFYEKKAVYDEKLNYDVIFVGANIANRQMYFDLLRGKNLKVGFFGKGWENGYVNSTTMLSLFKSSKVVLNFTKTIDNKGNDQLKGRMFEICMAGGFLLTEYFPEIEEYYELGIDIEVFKTKEEFLEKITYYLDNTDKLERIKTKGHEKTKKLYSFESVWNSFFESISNKKIISNNTSDKFIPTREHKLNFLMWNISFIKAYKSIKDTNSMNEYIDNIANSRYYSKALLKLIRGDSCIFDNQNMYKILRDEITDNTLTNLELSDG